MGPPIKNHGQRDIKGFTNEWIPMNMAVQVADVNRPLGSVHHLVKSGNTVIFDSRGSCVINKKSGTIIPIKEKNGNFTMDLWVKKKEERGAAMKKEFKPTTVSNQFGELPVTETDEESQMEVDEFKKTSMGFIRQALL